MLCVAVYVCTCHIWCTVDFNICTHLLVVAVIERKGMMVLCVSRWVGGWGVGGRSMAVSTGCYIANIHTVEL